MQVVSKTGLDNEQLAALKTRLEELGEGVRHDAVGDHHVFELKSERTSEILALQGVESILPDGTVEDDVDRRTFLDYCLIGAGALCGLATCGAGVAFLVPPRQAPPGGRMVYVCKEEELEENGVRAFFLKEHPALLIRWRGKLHALGAVCTHRNTCLVEWDGDRRQIVCPCHNASFDIYGNVLQGPPPRPLSSFEVLVVEGRVFVANRT